MKPNETDRTYEPEFHDKESRSDDDDDLAARDDVLELARIADFRQEALQNEQSLAGCVGPATSRLMEAEKHFARDVLDVLVHAKGQTLNNRELPGVMQTWLSLSRQIERNTNLYIR